MFTDIPLTSFILVLTFRVLLIFFSDERSDLPLPSTQCISRVTIPSLCQSNDYLASQPIMSFAVYCQTVATIGNFLRILGGSTRVLQNYLGSVPLLPAK